MRTDLYMKLHTELGRLWFSSKIVSQKAKNFGMKVFNGSKMTKDKRKHFKYHTFYKYWTDGADE